MEPSLRNTLLTALLALAFGFLGAAAWSTLGLADNRTRAYLLENPSILQDVAEALQTEQSRERIAEAGDDLYEAFPGAVMGNPEGSKVLIEFSDYNCGYCEASLADVNQLIAADPDLKVVIRELPLLAPSSEDAARMGLAAAMQGKYGEFHEKMFEIGASTSASVDEAAQAIGLDMERARADAASDAVSVELARNFELARSLGFSGTPAFIAGDTPLPGAVGFEVLKEALDQAGG